jgi:hypothetical protein
LSEELLVVEGVEVVVFSPLPLPDDELESLEPEDSVFELEEFELELPLLA